MPTSSLFPPQLTRHHLRHGEAMRLLQTVPAGPVDGARPGECLGCGVVCFEGVIWGSPHLGLSLRLLLEYTGPASHRPLDLRSAVRTTGERLEATCRPSAQMPIHHLNGTVLFYPVSTSWSCSRPA